jgi:predicted phage-related endonuclease
MARSTAGGLSDLQHELRSSRCVASNGAVYVGEPHPYATELSEFARLVEGIEGPSSPAARIGLGLEDAIARLAADELRHRIRRNRSRTFTRGDLAATPDAWILGEHATLETKAIADYLEELPRHWYWSSVGKMAVLGTEREEIFALCRSTRLVRFTVERDPAAEARLIEGVERFMAEHIRPRIPPDPAPGEAELYLACVELEAGTIVARGRTRRLGDRLARLAARRLAAEKAEAAARDPFIAELARLGATEALAPGVWSAAVTDRADGRRGLRFTRR